MCRINAIFIPRDRYTANGKLGAITDLKKKYRHIYHTPEESFPKKI